jgi:NADP-dependent 3-hydroxy acid dehydrogenase YdfG
MPQAGFALDATVPFWEQDMETVQTVMDVNLNGLLSITRKSCCFRRRYLLIIRCCS